MNSLGSCWLQLSKSSLKLATQDFKGYDEWIPALAFFSSCRKLQQKQGEHFTADDISSEDSKVLIDPLAKHWLPGLSKRIPLNAMAPLKTTWLHTCPKKYQE